MDYKRVRKGIGLFSVALGVAVLAMRWLGRKTGSAAPNAEESLPDAPIEDIRGATSVEPPHVAHPQPPHVVNPPDLRQGGQP